MSSTVTQTATQSSRTPTTTLTGEPSSPSPAIGTSTAAPSSATSSGTTAVQKQEDEEELDIYDEIEIEDMVFDTSRQLYHYPCPCGDRFEIHIEELRSGSDIAVCPGCSLMIRVIFDEADLPEKDSG